MNNVLNTQCRVSLKGRVTKVDATGVKVAVIGSDGVKREFKLNVPSSSVPLVRVPLKLRGEYMFSNVRSSGTSKPLQMDAVSVVTAKFRVVNGQMDRLISVPPAVLELAQEGVFAEVLTSPGDLVGACISPLQLLSGDDGRPSEDPFIRAARSVEAAVNDFFGSVSEAVKKRRGPPDGKELVAPEIPHLRLGSGTGTGPGYGVGLKLAKDASNALYDTLKICNEHVDSITYSSQAQFILLEIFCKGFGNDMMNDFFSFNMFESLVTYTDSVAKQHTDTLKSAGLVVKVMSLRVLIDTFKASVKPHDWNNWVEWCGNGENIT